MDKIKASVAKILTFLLVLWLAPGILLIAFGNIEEGKAWLTAGWRFAEEVLGNFREAGGV